MRRWRLCLYDLQVAVQASSDSYVGAAVVEAEGNGWIRRRDSALDPCKINFCSAANVK